MTRITAAQDAQLTELRPRKLKGCCEFWSWNKYGGYGGSNSSKITTNKPLLSWMNAENRASQINFFCRKVQRKSYLLRIMNLMLVPSVNLNVKNQASQKIWSDQKWSKKVKSLNTKSQKFEKSCWFATPGIHSNFYSNRLWTHLQYEKWKKCQAGLHECDWTK